MSAFQKLVGRSRSLIRPAMSRLARFRVIRDARPVEQDDLLGQAWGDVLLHRTAGQFGLNPQGGAVPSRPESQNPLPAAVPGDPELRTGGLGPDSVSALRWRPR